MGSAIGAYFRNPDYGVVEQSITGIAIGLLLSPYSFGLITYLVFIIAYESIYYAATRGDPRYAGDFYSRFIVNTFSVVAFIVGRILVGQPIIGSFDY